jgi:RNA recognition motif-containing protein
MPKNIKDKHSASESESVEEKPQKWTPKQLFVSGLPYETNEEQLKEFFGAADIESIKMPKYQDTGRCVGYAHVLFTSQKSYESALAKSG